MDVTFTMGIYSTLDQRFIVYFNLISVLTVDDRLAPPPPIFDCNHKDSILQDYLSTLIEIHVNQIYIKIIHPNFHNLILFRWSKDKMNMQFDNELCIEVLYFNLVKFCEEIYHIIQVLFHFFCLLYMYVISY